MEPLEATPLTELPDQIPQQLGRYRLIRSIGKGGSADVIVAEVHDTDPPPANNNKVMVWAYDDDADSDSWDPVGIVYFKVYDSTIGPEPEPPLTP